MITKANFARQIRIHKKATGPTSNNCHICHVKRPLFTIFTRLNFSWLKVEGNTKYKGAVMIPA
jgi:hypothetical protein